MVPYQAEVFVIKGRGTKNVEGDVVDKGKAGIAQVQHFAEIAMKDVVEDGAPILVNLLALKFQDLKKKSLRLLQPQ